MFAECEKLDDLEMRKDIQEGVDDPAVNLPEFDDFATNDNNMDDVTETEFETNNVATPSEPQTVFRSLIKHFNQHSIMVLKASKISKKTDAQKMQKIREKITYDDLMEDDKADDNLKLNLDKVTNELILKRTYQQVLKKIFETFFEKKTSFFQFFYFNFKQMIRKSKKIILTCVILDS